MNEIMAYKNKDVEQRVIEEITTLHNDIQKALETTFQKALRLGELLTAVKDNLPHGQFQNWIENNLPFKQRAARNYMLIFDNKNLLEQHAISTLAGAFKLLSDMKTARHAVLTEDIQITEIDESKELNELYTKIEELNNEKERLENELIHKMNEVSRLNQDLNDEIRLKRDKKIIIEAMEKLTDHTGDKEKLERDFSDLTETLKYINASKNFFRKQTLKLQAMDLTDCSIKVLKEDVGNLLDIIDNWGVVVAKKFNIKMK